MDKRMIVPALFGILFIVAVAAYASLFLLIPFPPVVKLIIGLVVAALAISMGYLIIQRNRELKEEDKDDLSKY
jgi:Kef-type K+ transport system membrane component KefB